MYDLTALSGTDEPAVGHDISDNGIVVGQVGGVSAESGLGIAIDLTTSTFASCTLATFEACSTVTDWSIAYAVNNANPPVAVGDSAAEVGDPPCDCTTLGFRVTLDFANCGALTLDSLAPLRTDNASFARDINTPATGGPQIAGFSWVLGEPGLCTADIDPCEPMKDAVVWDPTLPGYPRPHPLPALSPNGSEARGNNDNSQIAGFERDSTSECPKRARFWPSSTSPPVDLGGIMPQGQQGDESHAEAVSNMQIVAGWNVFARRGLLWQEIAGQWQVTDLTDALVGPCSSGWTVRQAHDINTSDGWIVCIADTPDPGLELHVVVLTPADTCVETCLGDINGDGTVDPRDLAILLSNYGPCVGCPADLNCDGVVDPVDLAILLTNWGPCDGLDGGAQAALEAAVIQLGFADLAECQAWLTQADDTEALIFAQLLLTLLDDQG